MTARELRPLGEALGTEALGIDLSKPLDDETFVWIEHAFAEHPVLVFRDQDLGPGELAVFGRRFGTPKIHSLVDYRHAAFPEVSWLTNVDKDGSIDWFFREWVNGTDAPKLAGNLKVADSGGGKYHISGTITQSQVPNDFASIVPLYLTFDKG